MNVAKKRKYTLVGLALIALIFVFFAIGGISLRAGAEYSLNVETVQYQAQYSVGERVTVLPFSAEIDGESKQATVTVYSPSGIAYSKDVISVTESGRYTVEYKIVSGEKTYKGYQYFDVISDLYSITDKYSSAEYDEEQKSIKVSLNVGAEFRYNKPIDLSKCTADESLIEFSIQADVTGENNFKNLYFKLTDTANPDNYIVMRVRNNVTTAYDYTRYTAYVAARSADYVFTGYDQVSKKVRVGGEYGALTTFSFCNYAYDKQTKASVLGTTTCKLYFDYAERQVYVHGVSDKTGDVVYSKALVTDLDDLSYVGSVWNGFENGSAYLSVYAENYFKSAAICHIKKIGGEDISLTSITDNEAPKITVDYGEYTQDTVPYGLVGQSYLIFPATAYDVLAFDTQVLSKVYYNYYSSVRVSVNVKDGKFVPTRTGKYTIEYKTRDSFGNSAVVLCDVMVKNTASDIQIGEVSIADVYTGTLFEVPVPSVSGDNDLGATSLTAIAVLNGEEYALENGCFRPMKAGTWTLRYVATDYVGRTVTKEAPFTVTDGEDAIFIEDIERLLPKYLVAGNQYVLPNFQTVSFVNGEAVFENADIRVSSGVIDGNVFYPTVDENGAIIQITYSKGEKEVVYERPCFNLYDGADLNAAKVFVATQGAPIFEVREHGVAAVASTVNIFDYVNALLSHEISLKFSVAPFFNNVNKVSFILTDSENAEIQLKFTFAKDGDLSRFIINNLSSFTSNASFTGTTSIPFEFSYVEKAKKVFVNAVGYTVSQTLNGEPFEGFTSGKAYLSVYMEEVTGNSEIIINSINGHNFSDIGMDGIAPQISVLGNVGGMYSVNEDITLPRAVSRDVINGLMNVLISVRYDGAYVTDMNGVTLKNVSADKEYVVRFSEYGTYQITYSATDNQGNTATYRRNIIIVDEVAPTVEISGKLSGSYKVGETVEIPKINAKDNTCTPQTYIYIVTPEQKCEYISELRYIPKTAGKYTVVFNAIDEQGNLTIVKRTFTVR